MAMNLNEPLSACIHAENTTLKSWASGVLLLELHEAMQFQTLSSLVGSCVDSKSDPFIFSLRYCEPPEHFEELSRYIWELDEHTGTQGAFKGVSVINLSQWVGSEPSEYLDAFLAYLYDHQKHIRYVFTVPCECRYTAMKEKLEEYFEVHYIARDDMIPDDERRE